MKEPISRASFLGVVLVCFCAVAGAVAQDTFPLAKGMQWTYQGKVEWTVPNSAIVRSTNIQWVTEVIDVVKGRERQAAVVRGFPTELAWYEPKQVPGYCVVLSVTNRIFLIHALSEKDGEGIARNLTQNFKLPAKDREFLNLPLDKDKRWAGDVDRDDFYYCWHVEGQKTAKLKVDGSRRRYKVWTIAYRTLPDHQVVDIADGVGITRYVYAHHGTVAFADVRLVSFRIRESGSGIAP